MSEPNYIAAARAVQDLLSNMRNRAEKADAEAREARAEAYRLYDQLRAEQDNAQRRIGELQAEAELLRVALHVVLDEVDLLRAYSDRLFACEREGCPTEGCDDHDPQYVWGYVGRVERAGLHARAALTPED